MREGFVRADPPPPRPRPSYASDGLTVDPVRKIRDQLYRQTHYDAIWWLGNSAFVIRLEGLHVLLDPILFAPHAAYSAARKALIEAGKGQANPTEWKYYDNRDNYCREIHELPLLAEEVEKPITFSSRMKTMTTLRSTR